MRESLHGIEPAIAQDGGDAILQVQRDHLEFALICRDGQVDVGWEDRAGVDDVSAFADRVPKAFGDREGLVPVKRTGGYCSAAFAARRAFASWGRCATDFLVWTLVARPRSKGSGLPT